MTPKYLPHICHFWHATALFRGVKLHLKVREFGTKIVLLHNSFVVPGVRIGDLVCIIGVLVCALDVFGIGILHTFVTFCIWDR